MKFKRYLAADMRSALAAVRDEQGSDAVILSTRTLSQGVEVCAAVDLELAAGHGTLAETAALKQLERAALEALERDGPAAGPNAQGGSAQADAVAMEWAHAAANAGGGSDAAVGGARALAEFTRADAWVEDGGARTRATTGSDASRARLLDRDEAHSATLERTGGVEEELRSLRALLEQQVAALAWNDFTRREPLKARALTDLARLGLDSALALQILAELPPGMTSEQSQRMPYALLARRIQTSPPPAQVRGALALVGPSGGGKTTTLAKLAARYVLEQDAANLLLVSTDDERLGAHDQLRSLGRVLGVRVEIVLDGARLATRIAALPDRCILIDTPGASRPDSAAATQYRLLREHCAQLTSMLVLPASAQAGVVEDAVAQFGAVASGCVLTRIDEAVSLGGTLSALVRSQLPVAYCAEGARIPEDLRPARAHQLVARAVELARIARCAPDDELLARRYGGSLHAAA